MWCIDWDDFVRGNSMRYGGMEQTPEGIMESYHGTNKRLMEVRERLTNPINLKRGGPLQPSSIRQFERQEKELIQRAGAYRKLIKRLVKYNLLPTSKLIAGKHRAHFVFSLATMIELPEFGRAVYYANRLLGSRYDDIIPSTNEGYAQCLRTCPGRSRNEKEERSRESMYDALVESLNAILERIKKERQRLLFSGDPWKPPADAPASPEENLDYELHASSILQKTIELQESIMSLGKEREARLEAEVKQLEERLKVRSGVKNNQILTLINGKVRKSIEVHEPVDDGLTSEFRSFLMKERRETDHHADA